MFFLLLAFVIGRAGASKRRRLILLISVEKVDDLGVVGFGDVGHRHRVLMDMHADVERARLGQG